MDVVALLVILCVFALAAWIVAGPLRAGSREADVMSGRVADLVAAREAKYREIRESEMDYRTGKLSEEDWRIVDRQLRAEAVAILRELDRYDQDRP